MQQRKQQTNKKLQQVQYFLTNVHDLMIGSREVGDSKEQLPFAVAIDWRAVLDNSIMLV